MSYYTVVEPSGVAWGRELAVGEGQVTAIGDTVVRVFDDGENDYVAIESAGGGSEVIASKPIAGNLATFTCGDTAYLIFLDESGQPMAWMVKLDGSSQIVPIQARRTTSPIPDNQDHQAPRVFAYRADDGALQLVDVHTGTVLCESRVEDGKWIVPVWHGLVHAWSQSYEEGT